jgi:hypothetical protein
MPAFANKAKEDTKFNFDPLCHRDIDTILKFLFDIGYDIVLQ